MKTVCTSLICLALAGCAITMTIDPLGNRTWSMKVDSEGLAAIVAASDAMADLMSTHREDAILLANDIKELLEKPDSPSKIEQLLQLTENARDLLELISVQEKAAAVSR